MRLNIWSYTWCRDMHGRQPFFSVQERTFLERPSGGLYQICGLDRSLRSSGRARLRLARESARRGGKGGKEKADWPKTPRRKVTKASPPGRYHTTGRAGAVVESIFGA